MNGFKKEKHNPVELLNQFWPGNDFSHITYDENLRRGEYDVIRQSGSDGTLMFTIEMLQNALINIAKMHSHYTKTEPKDWSKVKGIRYTLGPMKHATVYGMIHLRCSKTHKYPGQRERVRMPVKCEYILTTE
ncbi:MAG: hypothetical protein V3R67_08815 [Thermodesulfobacteriota bacterium]